MASTVANSTLQVGMLSIPVALRSITDAQEVKIDRTTLAGNKIARSEVDSETGEVVTADGIQKGVWEGDVFKVIASEALEAIDEATKLDVFEISDFIPLADVPWERAQNSYFLAPQKAAKGSPAGAKAMTLLLKALKKRKAAGVMKVCLKSRQRLAVVYPKGGALFVTVLAWSEDWKQADEANVLEGVAVEQRAVDMAVTLIDTLMAPDSSAALDAKVDDLRVARAKLVEDAIAGKVVKKKGAKAPAAAEEDGLMGLLQASLKQAQKVPA